MARALAYAQSKGRVWSLQFENGLHDSLRIGGYYAGHETKEDLKNELRRQFREQEQREVGETLARYLEPISFVSPSASHTGGSETEASIVNAERLAKVSPDVAALDHGQGDLHAKVIPTLRVPYSTRAFEKKSKLEAAEKQRLLAAQKKQKLANDVKTSALGTRRAIRRSSRNL